MEEQPPNFGGKPGELVPQVDPDDLKAAWKFLENSPAGVATGEDLLRQLCKPGADVAAVGYRAGMLDLLTKVAPERLEPWSKEGRLGDRALEPLRGSNWNGWE